MKITIEPTEHFFMADDVVIRAWKGQSADGLDVTAFVCAVQVEGGPDHNDGLVSIPPPNPEDAQRWAQEVVARAMTLDQTLQPGEIVQIKPSACRGPEWFGACLMIVTEPKPWGAQGYVKNAGTSAVAYIRVKSEDFIRTGVKATYLGTPDDFA